MLSKTLLAVPLAAALGLLAMPRVQAHEVPSFLAVIAPSGLLVSATDDISNETADEIDGQPDNSETDDTVDTVVSYDGENSESQPVYVPSQPPVDQTIFVPNGDNDVQGDEGNVQNDETDTEQGDNNNSSDDEDDGGD